MPGSVIVSVLALVFLGIAVWLWRTGQVRRRWPSVRGTVIAGRIRRDVSGDGDDETVTYVPMVEYRYEINSRSYTSSGIGFVEAACGSSGRAEKVLARYPAGAVVEVHYNPAKPGEAFLEFSNILAYLFAGVGGVILAVAVILAFLGL